MTLHPDILTDLVILYHAGEASQASRALLEEEAVRNPQIAAALSARPMPVAALPTVLPAAERKVFRKVRLRYQALTFAGVWLLALLAVVALPYLASSPAGVAIAINAIPFAVLLLALTAMAGGLYFLVRAVR